MATKKKSFILYGDYEQHLKKLTDIQRGQLFLGIFEYFNHGVYPKLDVATDIAFSFIQSNLERDCEKWEATLKARSESGRKGGLASGLARQKSTDNHEQSNEANEADNETDNETENETEIETGTGTARKEHKDKGTMSTVDFHGSYGVDKSYIIKVVQFVAGIYDEYLKNYSLSLEDAVKVIPYYLEVYYQTFGKPHRKLTKSEIEKYVELLPYVEHSNGMHDYDFQDFGSSPIFGVNSFGQDISERGLRRS